MRRFFIILLLIFSFLIFVKSTNATTCIPSFFTGNIVVATLDSVQFNCSEKDQVRSVDKFFSKNKDIYGKTDQTFTLESEFYNPENVACSEIIKQPNFYFNNEGSLFKTQSMYVLKLQKENERALYKYSLPHCVEDVITQVSSENDKLVDEIKFNAFKNNLLLIIILFLVGIPSYFAQFIDQSGIPSNVGFIVNGIFSVSYVLLLLYGLYRLLKFLIKKIRLLFKKKV